MAPWILAGVGEKKCTSTLAGEAKVSELVAEKFGVGHWHVRHCSVPHVLFGNRRHMRLAVLSHQSPRLQERV